MFHVKQPSPLPESVLGLIAELSAGDPNLLISRVQVFRDLILEVNAKINLISRQNSERVVDDLLYDSITLLRFIIARAGTRILDLGSGAGFPGLVIAAAHPQLNLISVEANRRKIEFQRHAVREMGLANVRLLSDRIERLQPLNCDIAIAKAVASIEGACRLIVPHLVTGGDLFLPRSQQENCLTIDWTSLDLRLEKAELYQSATNQRKSLLIHTKKL